MKAKPHQPDRLDVERFAAEGGLLQGDTPTQALPRLADAVLASDSQPVRVRWTMQGERRRLNDAVPRPALHLKASMQAALQCQRCLGAVFVPLTIDRHFVFAHDEDEAARIDEEHDDDVLAASRSFDALTLLEDELILALPIVARHEQCDPPAALRVSTTDDDSDATQRPFEVLRTLKPRQ